MNWLIRLGKWLEQRKSNPIIRKKDLENSMQIPQTIAKEIALLKIRLDQMELYVGLKREPRPEHIPGIAKIS